MIIDALRTSKKTLDAHLQIWRSEIGYGAPVINASEPTGMRRARASPPRQYRDDPLLPVQDGRANRQAAIVGPSPVPGKVFPSDRKSRNQYFDRV